MFIGWSVEQDVRVLKEQDSLVVRDGTQEDHFVHDAELVGQLDKLEVMLNVLDQSIIVATGDHEHMILARVARYRLNILRKTLQGQVDILFSLISVQTCEQGRIVTIEASRPLEQLSDSLREVLLLNEVLLVDCRVEDLGKLARVPKASDKREILCKDALGEPRVDKDCGGEASRELFHKVEDETICFHQAR